MNIKATLRGRRYDLSVSKVAEVQKYVEEKSGLRTGQQVGVKIGICVPVHPFSYKSSLYVVPCAYR